MSVVYVKNPEESLKDFICRIGKEKENIGTWDKVASILNDALGLSHGESYYRKIIQGTYGKKYKKPAEQSDIINNKIRDLEVAKIQLRDERTAWNKQNYIAARVEQKLDYLEEVFEGFSKYHFPKITNTRTELSDNDALVLLSDFHIGQCFDSSFGTYDPEIAWLRLNKLYFEIIDIKKRHNCENCYISLLGDLISGNIHKNIQVTNRENVIEQIKTAVELISSFCYQLAGEFKNVYFTDVTGNHSRIDKKEDAIHDERLDSLVSWMVEKLMKDVDNFEVVNDKLDTGISVLDIRGKNYVSVHGDYDSYSKGGVLNLASAIGFIPYAVLFGHNHTCAFSEVNNIKMIRGGSLSGSGDQHTIEKRLTGKPSQMVCVCDENGVECCYPIELDID